jgi:hypothetical protein
MKLQVIQDNKGKTTGVYIPIQEWNVLKKRYKDLENIEQKALSKDDLILDLKEALNQISRIEKGKLKTRTGKALLREL